MLRHAIYSLILLSTIGLEVCAEERADRGLALFENEVRPLLVESCYKCHGPRKQEAGLRLDSQSGMLRGGESNAAIVVPSQPENSLLLQVVEYDGDIQMPPERKLNQRQIALLRRWIELGAPRPIGGPSDVRPGAITDKDRSFWSFQPVAEPSLPRVKDTSWPRSPVDYFVLRRLEEANVHPVDPASRRTLIRRVTFDLTGLPPTPLEINAFESDFRPGAFHRVIDRLLASPAYGERWGRHWLDVVRYADSAGETADYPLPEAYRYRNYVIDAFNVDKPYDEFVHEQIAGDILARQGPRELYAERATATGFIALSRRFGYDSEKYHHMTIQDTVDTLGQSILGLSLGCARCHPHKFDPITSEDYYSLFGIFASTRYSFPGSEEKQKYRSYLPLLPPAEAEPVRLRFERRVAELEARLAQLDARVSNPFALGSIDDIDGDFQLQRFARGGSYGTPVDPWWYEGDVMIETASQSPFQHAFRFGTVGARLADNAELTRLWQEFQPVSDRVRHLYFGFDFRLRVEDDEAASFRISLGRALGGPRAIELSCRSGTTSDFGLSIQGSEGERRKLQTGQWHHVNLKLDLESQTFQGSITPFDQAGPKRIRPTQFAADWSGEIDSLLVEQEAGSGALDIDNVFLRRSVVPAPPPPPENAPTAGQSTCDELAKKSRDALKATLQQELTTLIDQGPYPHVYGVAEGYAHDERIQKRGDPAKRGNRVRRRWLSIFDGENRPGVSTGSGRLELAGWLTENENPLTARVIVNRIWQHHFGNGLVRTENDFGRRGEAPTHPELLDYLAARLVASGWSIKRLHRTILVSSTYRLSSAFDQIAADADPNEELLWRFPRRRLDAESIRDAMLATSGKLDRSKGGPHPFPSLAKQGYSQHGPFRAVYPTDRRSVYLMVQRTKRHPFLSLFDSADPNASTAKRKTTTVPTQALYFINDAFVHEQSRHLAERLISANPNVRNRIELGFELTLGRKPTERELEQTDEFLDRYRRSLKSSLDTRNAGAVEELQRPHRRVVSGRSVTLDPGHAQYDESSEIWAAFARTLFSRNEFIYID